MKIFPAVRIPLLATVLYLMVFVHPAVILALDEFRGPRLELGGVVGYSFVSQNPVWSAKTYRTGSVTGAFRFYRGLSVQGGYEGSLEENINVKSLDYSSTMLLKSVNGSYYGGPWLGVRYEVPADILKGYRFGSHSVLASLGYSWARFGVATNDWILNGVDETDNPRTKYHVADVSGPYGSIAVRWRFDAAYSKDAVSWIGAHGFDVGVKFTRYTSCSTRFEKIDKSTFDFSFLQIFVIGFIKLGNIE